MRQSPLPDNTMTEQFASISSASTPLLDVRARSLTPPYWDLSPDEASPSQSTNEGPPVASLLLDATQTDTEVVQPKAEDDQNDKKQAETTTTSQTENREPENEDTVPSTPTGPLATIKLVELPKLTMETLTKPHEVGDIRVVEGASGHVLLQGAKESTPTPSSITGTHLAMIEDEKLAPYEVAKDDSTSVHQGSVETKDSSELSSDQGEEEERILLYPAKPWGSSYKKRYTPSARLITRLIEKHHADSDAADAGPARTRRQRRRKATSALSDIPTSSYIPTSDASAETSADTDPPQLSRKLSRSRLKPKLASVAEARKAPAVRRDRPPGKSSKTGRSARSGNREWEENSGWDSKSSSEEPDDNTYISLMRRRSRVSFSPPSVRSHSQMTTSSRTTRRGNKKAKPKRKQRGQQTFVCVEIPPWKGSSKGTKPQVSDTEVASVRPSTKITRSRQSPRARSEKHSESTNAALIEAHSEEWYTRTFDTWWIEAVVIPLSEEIALRVHGHIHLPNTTVVWHSSHIINVINPTLVATHKRKLYQLNGALDPLQMANNGFTAVEIKRFSKGFPSDWQEVLKHWVSQRSQNNLVNTLPGPTPPVKKYSDNTSSESTVDERQLAPQSSPSRQPLPTRLPKARKRLVRASLIRDEDQPMIRSLRSSGKAPEPPEEEVSASEEEEESPFGEQESAPKEPSTRTLRASRKAPESKQRESSPEEPLTRTRRASRKAPEPSLEEESALEERSTRTRRSSKNLAPEPSASEYEPAMEAGSISEDDDSAPASSLTPRSLKRNRAPKGFYKVVDSTEQEDAGGRERNCPSPSDFSGGRMESKKRRRRNADADEFVPPNKDRTEQTRVGVNHRKETLSKSGADSNRILRGLSVDSVEVLPTRLRSETRTTTTPSPTSLKAPASSRSLRSRSTVSPSSHSLPRTRPSMVSGSKAASAPRRLVLEAVVIPVWNRNKAVEKSRLDPEIKEEAAEEEKQDDDDNDEEGLELMDGPPLVPLNALTWHPSLSTFKNFRPVSMSPSLYTRSQNVVEQLKRQTGEEERVEGPEEEMDMEMEEGQEVSHQGEGVDDVVAETDMAMEQDG
ncbi:hypothetical protein BGZ92_004692 [Podila epicladia]|nr:hypothetical protein BGZ92_004692 [Podila epicladia]